MWAERVHCDRGVGGWGRTRYRHGILFKERTILRRSAGLVRSPSCWPSSPKQHSDQQRDKTQQQAPLRNKATNTVTKRRGGQLSAPRHTLRFYIWRPQSPTFQRVAMGPTDPYKIDTGRSNRTEPNRTEPNRTEPNRTEPNRTEPNRIETEPNNANRIKPN